MRCLVVKASFLAKQGSWKVPAPDDTLLSTAAARKKQAETILKGAQNLEDQYQAQVDRYNSLVASGDVVIIR